VEQSRRDEASRLIADGARGRRLRSSGLPRHAWTAPRTVTHAWRHR